jgi:hypothetical protein
MREYIKIPLPEDEYATLSRLAELELRPVSMQAHYLLRQAMQAAQGRPTGRPAELKKEVDDGGNR